MSLYPSPFLIRRPEDDEMNRPIGQSLALADPAQYPPAGSPGLASFRDRSLGLGSGWSQGANIPVPKQPTYTPPPQGYVIEAPQFKEPHAPTQAEVNDNNNRHLATMATNQPDRYEALMSSWQRFKNGDRGQIMPALGGLPGLMGIQPDYNQQGPSLGERMFVDSVGRPLAQTTVSPVAAIANKLGVPGMENLASAGQEAQQFSEQNPPQSNPEAILRRGASAVNTTALLANPVLSPVPSAMAGIGGRIGGAVLGDVGRMAGGIAGFTAGQELPGALADGGSIGETARSAAASPLTFARSLTDIHAPDTSTPEALNRSLMPLENLAVIGGLEEAHRGLGGVRPVPVTETPDIYEPQRMQEKPNEVQRPLGEVPRPLEPAAAADARGARRTDQPTTGTPQAEVVGPPEQRGGTSEGERLQSQQVAGGSRLPVEATVRVGSVAGGADQNKAPPLTRMQRLKAAADAAEARIAAKGTTVRSGIDPSLAKDYAIAGTSLAAEGAGKIGEEVAKSIDERPFVTSIKNVTTNQERAAEGLPEMVQTLRGSMPEFWDAAKKKLDANPDAANTLISELQENSRPLTAVENAMILHKKVGLINDLNEARRARDEATAAGNEQDAAAQHTRMARITDERRALEEVTKASGWENSVGLSARKMMADQDYSLSTMIAEKEAAGSGEPLKPEQQKEVEAVHDKIVASGKAHQDIIDTKEKQASQSVFVEHAREIEARLGEEVKQDVAAGRKPRTPKPQDIAKQKTLFEESKKAPEDISKYAKNLEEMFLRQGVKDREERIGKVREAIKEVAPDISRRETMDALSNYGKYTLLNKDAINVQLRQGHGEMQQLAKLEDMMKGQAPLKTGMERREPSDVERRLIKQVNEMKKKLGFRVTDPATQLRSALESQKTRLNNSIRDIEHELSTGKKTIKSNTPPPSDAETARLKTRLDDLRSQRDEIFGKPELTPEQKISTAEGALKRAVDTFGSSKPLQTSAPWSAEIENLRASLDKLRAGRDSDPSLIVSRAEKAAGRAIEAMEKKIAAGGVTDRMGQKSAWSSAIADMKARQAELRKTLDDLRPAKELTDEQRLKIAMSSVEKAIAENQRRISTGDLFPGKPPSKTPQSPELDAARAKNDALKEQLKELQLIARPKKTAEEVALQSLKTRMKNRTAELHDKLAAGDFSTRQRRPVELDPEATALKVAHERVKQDWQQALRKDRLAKREKWEKLLDGYSAYRREAVLSSPITIPKLAAAATVREVTRPMESAISSGWAKVFPSLAEGAPLEGGLNIQAEAKAASQATDGLMKAMWQKFRTGKSDIDVLYGNPNKGGGQEFGRFFGSLHAVLKEPTRRHSFFVAQEKLMAHAMAHGEDVTNPLTLTRIGTQAMEYADRQVFQQQNGLTKAITAFQRTLEAKPAGKDSPTVMGKAGATLSRVLLPVKSVPTNIVSEIGQYTAGLPSGIVRALSAIHKGAENVPTDQKEIIFRHLSKGSIGAAALLTGFYSPQMFGGYYQPGKKDESKAKFGAVKTFGVNIPSFLLHNPLLEVFQIGATVRHVFDSSTSAGGSAVSSLAKGAVAGATGAVQQVPLVREHIDVAHLMEASKQGKAATEFGKSLIVPQAVLFAEKHLSNEEPKTRGSSNPYRRSRFGTGGNPYSRRR